MTISHKFTLWIVSIILAIGIFSTYFYFRLEMTKETKRLESFGSTIGPVLVEGLKNYMMTRDFDVLDKELHHLKGIKPINGVLLINREGIIKVGTDEKVIGTRLADTDPECQRCYEQGKKGVLNREKGVFQWIQPVENRPECYKCHDQRIKNNGFFVIDFSLKEFEEDIRKDIAMGLLIFLLSLAIIGLTIIVLSKSVIIKRLNATINGIEKFKEGDYNTRIPIRRKDEITELESLFNEMAETINDREREKQLLFKQMSDSYNKWEATFDSITDLISIHDKDFNIITANRAFKEYFSLSSEDVINKKCYDFFHGTDSPTIDCPHSITLNNNRPATGEILNTKTNRIFLITTFPFHFPEAEFSGSIHVARDITEEKEKEMRLIMSERLASLGQMASGIAHEINNPLASIAGCAEGLLNRVKTGRFDPVLFENYLKIIEEEISRCKDITTSMLSFIRKTTYEKKEININEVLDRTLEIIGFQGRLRGIEVKKDYKEGLPVIVASEGELRQVLMAIITNALDAMQDRGTLTVETGALPPSTPLTPLYPPLLKGGEGGFVFIKISDSGIGIPAENINRIFAPFFTTKSEKGGTGLGLSIAKKIITEHNGSIHVTSEEGKGTTFNITLPV